MILGDQGADVIKVEPIAEATIRGRAQTARRVRRLVPQLNRNKRSIALDLKSRGSAP